jgi:murein L,D-transpeptidase YcbB/YkuD
MCGMENNGTRGGRRLALLVSLFCLFATIQAVAAPNEGGGSQPQATLLQTELERYYAIRTAGGWGTIKLSKKFLQLNESAPAVVSLKQRLKATGEYASDDLSPLFTETLTAAVKRAQTRFGYKANGVVDAPLVKALNVSVEKRIAQLEVNLERLRAMPAPGSGTRLVANIPEYKLYVYEGDQLAFTMDIVVGSESNKTVIFNDEMNQVVFSPYWNVPPSIVKNEILPKMRGNREYLWRNRYVQTGEENGLPVIRQLPGAKNSLGKVKFVFPNEHNIYFHDTPAKSLFTLNKRAFSHGCIRLSEPAKLAEYLLRNSKTWTPAKISQAMEAGKEQVVVLDKPVPVSITYVTAFVDGTGLLHFMEDVYGKDEAESRSLAQKGE